MSELRLSEPGFGGIERLSEPGFGGIKGFLG